MALLQNAKVALFDGDEFDYQSEWHCSKTVRGDSGRLRRFDYQSEWHCSKTMRKGG